MADLIDLRSDTVTKPTRAMREAMYRAEVGDDVYGEDPSVNALQARAAELTGKEAALLVASGTMGNLVCVTAQCRAGDEVIVGQTAHVFQNEVGGIAAIGGVLTHTLSDGPGYVDPDAAAAVIHPGSLHAPGTRLICVEDTHNRAGGAVVPLDVLARMRQVADEHGIRIHLDGARVFNAAVALGVAAEEITRHADTLTFCLSKGLSAPVGSLVCGDRAFIDEAQRKRKVYGGGMRQAGVFAAAGLVALDEMIDRLADDHVTSRRLAEGLAEISGIEIDPETVRTNIVICQVESPVCDAKALPGLLREKGVLAGYNGTNRVRFVTHHGITTGDVDKALMAVRSVMASG